MIITDRHYLENTKCEETTIEYCKENSIFQKLADELHASKVPGVGLAGIQIGFPVRVGYIEYGDYNLKMINPRIIEKSEPIIYTGEGCLSSTEKYNTDRYNSIAVEYLDYDSGEIKTEGFKDFIAVVIQHECDHFDGILNYKREHLSYKIGRNDKCFCNSGLKYKKCHGK